MCRNASRPRARKLRERDRKRRARERAQAEQRRIAQAEELRRLAEQGRLTAAARAVNPEPVRPSETVRALPPVVALRYTYAAHQIADRIDAWGNSFETVIDLTDVLPGWDLREVCVMRHRVPHMFSFPDGSRLLLPPGRYLLPCSAVDGRALPFGISYEQVGRPSNVCSSNRY